LCTLDAESSSAVGDGSADVATETHSRTGSSARDVDADTAAGDAAATVMSDDR